MSEPKDFPKSFLLSGPYQVGMYLLVACTGYYFKGSNASGLLIDYIPFNPWLRLAAVLLLLHMVVTYLIKANVLSRAIHLQLSPKDVNDYGMKGRLQWLCITTSILGLSGFIANVIPFFESLTGLIGALLVPVACWNIPICFYFTMHQKQKRRITMAEWPMLLCMFLLGIMLTGLGTYANVKDIVSQWSTYGNPFSCLCEGMWDTCQCSATHTGMQCS